MPQVEHKNVANDYPEKGRPQVPTEATPQVEHKSAKTPLSEQGDVKEEGSVLWYATDD